MRRLWNKKSKPISRSICVKQYFSTGRRICKLLPQAFCDIWTWPNSISVRIRVEVVGIIEENESLIRIICRLCCVIDGRECFRERMFHSIYQYEKANNKHMNYYDQIKESSYAVYKCKHSARNKMSQKVPVDGFK